MGRNDAELGGAQLKAFIDELIARHTPGTPLHLTVIGLSYGSIVAAQSVRDGAHPDALVFVGSPGTETNTAADLKTNDPGLHVFAGKNPNDLVPRFGASVPPSHCRISATPSVRGPRSLEQGTGPIRPVPLLGPIW